MADGRMLRKKISVDPDINRVSDQAALLFTWMMSHADKEGRFHGDPATVKGLVVPRRATFTIEVVSGCLAELDRERLIEWYEDDSDMYVWFPAFDKNQSIRKDREADSYIPAPPGKNDDTKYVLRDSSDTTPGVRQESDNRPPTEEKLKGSEVKGNDDDDDSARDDKLAPAFLIDYSFQLDGNLAPAGHVYANRQEDVLGFIDDLGPPLVKLALDLAVEHGASSWSYAKKILTNWHRQGVTDIESARKLDEQRGSKHGNTGQNSGTVQAAAAAGTKYPYIDGASEL